MAVDPIMNDLQYAMKANQELEILNFYKSFPITCRARVTGFDRDTVELLAQPPGSVCLEGQSETILLSKSLVEAVRAQIVDFDLPSGVLRVKDFTYVGPHFGDRKVVRVQPGEDLAVEVETEDRRLTGSLADVSLSGVGLYLETADLEREQAVQLNLTLPEGEISLPGKIINAAPVEEHRVRYSIAFTRNAPEIAVVMRYIRDRRGEIIAEVQRRYAERAAPGRDEQP